MAKPQHDPKVKRTNITQIKTQLALLTAKLKEYECNGDRCTISGCKFVSDGLRLSQEVEILRKENISLREENALLKKKLGTLKIDTANG